MKTIYGIICLLGVTLVSLSILSGCKGDKGKARILIFAKTAGYHHESIPTGIKAIEKLGAENNFDVDTTTDGRYFTDDSLKHYAAVVFLNTTDTADVLLDNYQKADFERYIQAGGGFVGVHAAADAEYHWGWYNRLVGASFKSHPAQQEATLNIVDASNESTKHLPNPWKRKDEWYNFKNLNKDVHVLIKIDEKSYTGGENGDDHPMAWYHDYDGGRAFYTELGHTNESYSEDNYLKHLLGGIKYAIGDNKELNYSKATTFRVPEKERFTKTQLVAGTFTEPTEMTILPNLDIMIVQRRGEIFYYTSGTKSVKQIATLNVYWKTSTPGVNAEEGVMGLSKDPDFAKNHFVYIYYSPVDTSVNRLSRFTMINDSIDLKSEKMILQLYSQREICCHTGGSIAFGKDRMLFLSTGDNSTPFDEPKQKYVNHGYAPLNDEPGHMQYDARRSAGNTNDLRGKILRIKVAEDGTYTIPDGNLFKASDKARGEIYVMGNRNPYRISVDQKNGFLYWGEVGPDASTDSLDTRGPRGYDEVNQAKKAGYFGWPLFIGNNYPYQQYNYTNGTTNGKFDVAHPMNTSRNNTGLQELPVPTPAFIYYPYAYTKDFPQVASGGRNAMAGPVYYTDMFPKDTRYPDYYNKKLFIYDWIRGWIKVVTMNDKGDFEMMEPFADNMKFNSMIDMEVGPDGKLYGLEYGTGWFSKNPDAGLFRLDFNGGNIPPEVNKITVDRMSGQLPFKITASVTATDIEKSKLKYTWDFGNGTTKETTEPNVDYTYNTAGDYNITVTVKDDKDAATKSAPVNVYAGNEAPQVDIKINGNQSFYFAGTPVNYEVVTKDKEDTATDVTNLIVSADYAEGTDKAGASMGHQVLSEAMMGKNLMQSLDCKACHKLDEKSVGPAYNDVSKKYLKQTDAMAYLVNKIQKGGAGVWGEVAMPAHPDLKDNDARQLVSYILSLSAEKTKSLPAKGSLNATLNKPVKPAGNLYITASYTDKGGNNLKPMMGSKIITLRNSAYDLSGVNTMDGFSKMSYGGRNMMLIPANGSFTIDSIDLTSIKSIAMMIGWQAGPLSASAFDIYLDNANGKKLGTINFEGVPAPAPGAKPSATPTMKMLSGAIEPVTDGKLHNVYITAKAKDPKIGGTAALTMLQFMQK